MDEEEENIKEFIKNSKNLEFLGKGSFWNVYKLEYKGKKYAIKKISKEKIDNHPNAPPEYLKKALNRELSALRKILNLKIQLNFIIIS